MSSCKDLKSVWQHIKEEAKKLVYYEPILASFYYETLLKHKNFCDALSYILSNKLANSILPVISIQKIIEEIYSKNEFIINSAIYDLQAVCERDPAVDKYSTPILYLKGFHALQAYRIGHYLWKNNRYSMAVYIQNSASMAFAVDIHPAAIIGNGIMFDHATNIVIGETAVVENDVSILQSVTLGGTGKTTGDRHPKIREGVMIGAGAKILGNIEIGKGAKIGAGSVVLQSIPPHTTAAGIPARIVGKPGTLKPSIDMDQYFNCITENFKFGNGI